MKAIGFNAGLRGDLVMTTVAARAFKESYPDWKLTMAVGPQFSDMLPLFYQHPYYDNYHVWTVYENWPSKPDIDYLLETKYDISFHAFPPHNDEWWRYRHQYAEASNMVGLHVPKDINPVLKKWFFVPSFKKTIAFAPFAGYYNQSNDKRLSFEKAQEIVDLLTKKGYKVIQVGGPDEPVLKNTILRNTPYFESVRDVLSCELLIHTDTGIGHVAGAYKHPSLGLYGHRYYGGELVKNIQPISPNTKCLDSDVVENISIERIEQTLVDMGY